MNRNEIQAKPYGTVLTIPVVLNMPEGFVLDEFNGDMREDVNADNYYAIYRKEEDGKTIWRTMPAEY